MIDCWDCGTAQPAGALFCNECGAYLLDKAGKIVRKPADKLPFTDAVAVAPLQPSSNVVTAPIKPARITFIIPLSGRRAQIPLQPEITVGRGDRQHNFLPELDLTEDFGGQEGVSRRHALIRLSAKGIILIDLGSTNGTFLNNYQLPPERPYMVNSGDEVRFGDLLVHLFF